MPFSTLSDDFTDDCWQLSDAALRLHVEGICWSNRKLLDMEIPVDDIRKFKRPEAVRELLDEGYWTESDGKYIIQHHARYQRTKEVVIASQNRSRTNGAKGGRPPKSREQWNNRTQQATSTETSTETQQVYGGFEDHIAVAGKNPEMTGEENPAGYLNGNPKGEVLIRSDSYKAEETNYPTDEKGIKYRKYIDAEGFTSPADLVKARPKMSMESARKIWAAAFPDRRAA